jgi:hypothetical protein
MNRKLITISAAAAVMAFGGTAAVASADTTIIGSTGQSNQQGVNSSQSGENGSGGGSTYIIGDSTPTTVQLSANTLVNVQDIGGSGTSTLVAPAGDCFCQSNQQGVNSSQVADNGDGGGTLTAILGNSDPLLVQASANTGINVELIGAGPGDTTLIGGSGQSNDQAFNSAQSGLNGSGASGTLVVDGDSGATLFQGSANTLINVVLLGS